MKIKPIAFALLVSLHASMALAVALPMIAPLSATAATKMTLTAPQRAEQLEKMYVEYWEDGLKRNPIQATFVGDNRYNDQLPNFFAPSYRTESIAASKNWLKKLIRNDIHFGLLFHF